MKTNTIENTEKVGTLEALPQEKQEWLLDLAKRVERLSDLMIPLKEAGIGVSLSTLTRFVRKHRIDSAMKAGEELKESAASLVAEGKGEVFRKGSIEMVRQHLYDLALDATTIEEAKELYSELLKEEVRLREFEMEERKLQLAEEEARTRRARLRLEARRTRGIVRVASEPIRVEGKDVKEIEFSEVKASETRQDESRVEPGQVEALKGLLLRVEKAINQGGAIEEKVVEVREILGSERRMFAE